ncbi:AraC family transcriptional regulator [Aquimarina sp. ERC-38]|uniref:helix-turn-helix domain-containing protein n=1 Tax=Aquimarina sp. ERC-38 TaxID=2949996 RepID=UPI0022465DC2|nr:helix-turn-helix domain-containing protein [Aquimarina sp. ERC-38]UZO79952.1 AraC family transcriptional regulator [Aquimarina sp. ERC-38]
MIYPIKNNETIVPSLKNICILLSGSITIERDKVNTSVPSKSYFFFDTPFDIIAASPYIEGFVIQLDPGFLNIFTDLEDLVKKVNTSFDFKKIKNTDKKKNQIQFILNSESNPRLKESYLHILWSELLNDYISSQKEQSTIAQFSELIEQNIEQNYCAGTYAEMMGIPLKALIKEVKKSENKTPCNFITEKVIEKAKYKLLHTDGTSQMIAYQLGFEDPYYFIKYFKKNTTLTPTQFRTQFRDAV